MHNFDDFQRMQNLNRLLRFDHHESVPSIEVYFRDLEKHLIDKIKKADCVIGAVAWITNAGVLKALQEKRCLIVIQQEDFLRPDLCPEMLLERKSRLQKAYEKLRPIGPAIWQTGPFSQIPNLKLTHAIQAFGSAPQQKRYYTPKMHNKFLVFCHKNEVVISPYAVWTGSYNITALSNHSLENAMIVYNETIACAYANEAQSIYLESAPLDWTQSWIAPAYLRSQP